MWSSVIYDELLKKTENMSLIKYINSKHVLEKYKELGKVKDGEH